MVLVLIRVYENISKSAVRQVRSLSIIHYPGGFWNGAPESSPISPGGYPMG